MSQRKVLIIGAGAAGLIAGIMAAEEGAAVTILEHNEKPGKKIAATGNGRCNLTNLHMPLDAYRGSDTRIVQEVFQDFSPEDTLAFFEKIGVYPVNKNGYIYPRSNQASSVTDVLCMKAKNLGVKIKTREHVVDISRNSNGWYVQTEGWHYESDAVILANGSSASNIAGADGSGYELAKRLGHKIVKPLPALVPLKCNKKAISAWSGVRTEGKVTLYIDGKEIDTATGELQLTDYGISGIPVFQISRHAVRALNEKKKVSVTLNFLPDLSREQLHELLQTRRENCPYKSPKELFIGLFPEKLNKVLCEQKDLEKAISAFPLDISGYLSYEHAQICSGGVSVKEIDFHTLESKLQKDLYFAGELLDVDGICGGYNLQWAWSSGAVAGKHAAKESL